jgi:hypothetical protein
MTYVWEAQERLSGLWAAARVDTGLLYYVGLAVIVVIVIGTLIAAYRTWEEIHDVEEPDSPGDLLETFQQAHAQGEIDDQELDRVRRLLTDAAGEATAESAGSPPAESPVASDRPRNPEEDADSVQADGTGPRLP